MSHKMGDGKLQKDSFSRRDMLLSGTSVLAAAGLVSGSPISAAQAQPQPQTPGGRGAPNILFIMTDDVAVWNVSAYHRGMMGGSTPNIDRIAKDFGTGRPAVEDLSLTVRKGGFMALLPLGA